MRLPRWTVYPALAVVGTMLAMAFPRLGVDQIPPAPQAADAPSESGADESGELPPPPPPFNAPTKYPRMVVLGIDGLDPDILRDVMERHPERMKNFRRIAQQGSGVQALRTSTPPQSPVAWSNFITGRNPGAHGVFDFVHRAPDTRGVSSTTSFDSVDSWFNFDVNLWSDWKLSLPGSAEPRRTGSEFWALLRDAGVPASVWRMPINFPVEPSSGYSIPGMLTPAVDSAYGQCSFYTTDISKSAAISYDKLVPITERGGVVSTFLNGPENPFKQSNPKTHSTPNSRVPLKIFVDREANSVAVEVGDEMTVLQPGEWSDFSRVSFEPLPMGLQASGGMVRFYLRSIDPEIELYASPVNIDPTAPAQPVSEPVDASGEIADAIGLYYTQGMAEDVNALKKELLTDAEFMQQSSLVYTERRNMMDFALDKYMENEDGGFLFFYFSTVDLSMHMMWRHADPKHPFHDAVFAAQDSSGWSGRPGSKWSDIIDDLYMKMDPVVGEVLDTVGDATVVIMSDHGFAPFRRKFNLNTWLLDEGYLVLKEGVERELPEDDPEYHPVYLTNSVDWTKTRAYGVGFNGLYINRADRELDMEMTGDVDETGIVSAADVPGLVAELKAKLEAIKDEDGTQVVLRADLATEVYQGDRVPEAPDIVVGYNYGYGNSDESSIGQIRHSVLEDNRGGTFNGSHLMSPDVVYGTLLSNRPVREGQHGLEDLTAEILSTYGVEYDPGMTGHRVLQTTP